MSPKKAAHKAAVRSLGGHVHFVVSVDGGYAVFMLRDLAHCPKGTRIEGAYTAGKSFRPTAKQTEKEDG